MKQSQYNVQVRVALCALAVVLFGATNPARGDSFKYTGAMNRARYTHTATLLPNGKVLVAGGYDVISSRYESSAELYDPTSGTWTATGAMRTARGSSVATLLPNGKVLVAGGTDLNTALSSAEIYDPATETWTPAHPMNVAHSYFTATLLPDGTVLVAGGNSATWRDPYISDAELYDPATDTWTTTETMQEGRGYHIATLLPDGRVLVAGGNAPNHFPTSSAELFNPTTRTWTRSGSMASARYAHSATLLPTGKVLVAGGNSSAGPRSSAELYDPATGTWAGTGEMNIARCYSTTALLRNGKVLIAAGNDDRVISNAELYDSATGTWIVTGAMNTGRYYHTATPLPNGLVLMAGGYGIDSLSLSSAELYESIQPLRISAQPLGHSVHVGEPLSLIVIAVGTAPLSYQWQKDGVNIPNATDFTFNIATARASDAGNYKVIVKDTAATLPSDEVAINVLPGIIHRASATVELNSGSVASVTVTNAGFGYSSDQPPAVRFYGEGTGATAHVVVTDGFIERIIIDNPGKGYSANTTVAIAKPPFSPSLGLKFTKVSVTMDVVLGRKYRLDASTDLESWTMVDSPFVAEGDTVTQEFDVTTTGRYFRIQEVP